MAIQKATIEEVSTSGECHEYCAKIGPDGCFVGDKTETPGITVLNAEVPHHLNTEFGEFLLAGQLGDNILIRDLSVNITDLPAGTKILIQQEVVLVVRGIAGHYTKDRFPNFSPEMFEYLAQWGGATCDVEKGKGLLVCDGHEVEILRSEELKGAA
jgi:hypothetical protein